MQNIIKRILLSLIILLSIPIFSQRVIVFPFDDADNVENIKWLQAGIPFAINEMLATTDLYSLSYNELMDYYDQSLISSDAMFSKAAQLGIARNMGVQYVIIGSYFLNGETITIKAEFFILTPTIKKSGALTKSGNMKDLFGLIESLSKGFMASIKKPTNLSHLETSLEAFEYLIRGIISTDDTLTELYLNKAVEKDQKFLDAKYFLAKFYCDMNEKQKGLEKLESIIAQDFPTRYLAFVLLGELYGAEGKDEEADKALEMSLRLHENAGAHVEMGRLLLRKGNINDAKSELVLAERFGSQPAETNALRMEIKEAEKKKLKPEEKKQ